MNTLRNILTAKYNTCCFGSQLTEQEKTELFNSESIIEYIEDVQCGSVICYSNEFTPSQNAVVLNVGVWNKHKEIFEIYIMWLNDNDYNIDAVTVREITNGNWSFVANKK